MKKISKNGIIIGLIDLIAGLLVGIGPHTIFSVCEAMEGSYMKCHWTAQAESAIGIGIAILGVLLLFITDKKISIGVQLAVIVNFVEGLIIANYLIGVCGKSHMVCRSLTLPAINVISGVAIVAGIVYIVYLVRKGRINEAI